MNAPVDELPNFCAWLNGRFGRGWEVTRRGRVTPADFRRAKREYEALIGCRVYSPEYLDRFYGGGQP